MDANCCVATHYVNKRFTLCWMDKSIAIGKGFYYERCNLEISLTQISINSISNRICSYIATCVSMLEMMVIGRGGFLSVHR